MTTSDAVVGSAVNAIHDIRTSGRVSPSARRMDGAFWLIPPQDVTVFSEAGEPLLLTAEE